MLDKVLSFDCTQNRPEFLNIKAHGIEKIDKLIAKKANGEEDLKL